MNKRLFSVLLVMAVVLSMVLTGVWALEGNSSEQGTKNIEAFNNLVNWGGNDTKEYASEISLQTDEDEVSVAKIGDTSFTSLQDAFNESKDGDTIRLLNNAETDTINFTEGTRTIDLGGFTITSSASVIKISGGTLTVKNGTLETTTTDALNTAAININNGKLTLYSVNVSAISACAAIDFQGGALVVSGDGNYDKVIWVNTDNPNIQLSGGVYSAGFYTNDKSRYSNMLKKGYILINKNGTYTSVTNIYNRTYYKVVQCTEHTLDDKNVCKKCSLEHTHSWDASGKCETCDVQMEAKCGDTFYSTLKDAIDAATDGSTVTLLKEEVSSAYTYAKDYAITIDLNGNKWISPSTPFTIKSGHITLKNGMVWGGKNNSGAGITVAEGAQLTLGDKMIVKGTGGSITGSSRNYNQAIVLKKDSKLELAEDSVILGGLDLYNTMIPDNILPENTAFVRCTYDETTGKVTIPGADDGKYEFIQEAHKSTYYIDGDMAVVSHTHDFGTGGICTCGLITAAEVKGTLYRTITEAIEAAGENGTVKLIASEVGIGETITIDKPLTIDLNGKTLKGSVTVVNTLNLTDSRSDSATKGIADSITLGNGTTDGSLQILDDKVLVNTLTVNNKGKSPLTIMGLYNNIVCKGEITLADLLPNPVKDKYYAFKSKYADKFLSCTESEINQATGIYIYLATCTHEWNNSVCNYCNYQCVDHKFNENGICERCGTQTAALLYKDGEFVNGYKTLTEAFTAINDAAKSEPNMKLLLMSDNSMEQTLTASGNWTLDLNSLSLSNTTINVNGNLNINKLAQGIKAVTVENGAKLTIPVNQQIGRIENLTIENGGKAELSSGIYGSITNENTGGKLANLLADGYAFADSSQTDDRTIIDGYTPNNRTNLKVVAHTHNMGEDNKCACGLICNHEQHANGQCIKCGIPYAHTSEELTEDGGAYICSKCKQQMAVKVEKDNNTTYYAKRHETRYPYAEDTLKQVFNKAADGSTITLLEDNLFASGWVIGKNITLDLNGKNLIENNGIIVESENNATGKLTVTGRGSSTIPEDSMYTCTFRVSSDGKLLFDEDFSGKFGTIYVEGGKLTSDSKNMTFDALEIQNSGATVSLKGGTFGTITCSGGKTLGDMLAEGYAFKKADGSYVTCDTVISSSQAVENVTVVKCTHEKIENVTTCPYCESVLAATVTKDENTTGYTSAQEAVNKADGGTVKLLADVSETLTVSSTIKLDCNGHTIENLAVDSGVTLESLLPEGYAFKSNSSWVNDSDLSGKTKLDKATTAEAPIKSVTAVNSEMTMTFGEQAEQKINIEWPGESTSGFTLSWKNNHGAEGENYITTMRSPFTFTISPASAGEYIYTLTFTKDGYSKSCKFTVTVKKADAKVTKNPAAIADLTYDGTAHELIQAGTASGGTMVYSLTEDGDYTTTIPTGTNADTYTVWYKVKGDSNHEDSQPDSVEVEIAKKELSISDFTIADKTYDETTDATVTDVTFTGLVDGKTPELGTDFTATAKFDNANAGENKSVTVTVTPIENSTVLKNYKFTSTTFNKGDFVIAKVVPTVSAEGITVDYNGSAISVDKITGTAIFNGKAIDGTWSWKEGQNITDVADSGDKTVVFTPATDTNFKPAETTVSVIINKADVTGVPAYDKVTASGKKLSEVKLSTEDAEGKNLFSVDGKVAWENEDTEVKQGEKYKWIFTPTDNANYNTLTGEITLWPYSSGGGAALPAEDDVKTTTDSDTSKTTTSTTIKDTKTETVKDDNGNDISKITATVSEKVADKLVDQAVSNKSDTVEITVKSDNGNKVDSEKQIELEIPKSAVKDIADKTDASLVINTDNGQVVLDNKTLETIASETEGDTVRIVVNENTQLAESQKPAADVIGDNGYIFDLRAYIGDKLLHDFKGGKATVTLPMPEKLDGKDVVVIYINDKGICEILNHTVKTVGADKYIRFTTSHFSTYAIVESADAEKLIKQQNQDKAKDLIKEAKLAASTSKTSKKNVKVTIGVKTDKSLIKELKSMGYTVKYKYYRSTKKASKYTAVKTKTGNTYINTRGKKGTKYYYKAKVLVYDGKELIAQTSLKQCSYGVRTWSK